MMKIYTKTGDLGETSTLKAKRISKSSLLIKANGTVDELNANLGFIVYKATDKSIQNSLLRVQNELFDLGADLSLGDISKNTAYRYKITKDLELKLEKEIDKWEEKLPELKNFILPGGSELSSFIHIARSVCRRAERECVALAQIEKINPFVLSYLNRLSDWLFVLARYENVTKGFSEIKYESKNRE